ncbi:hypothetical protein LCGC14_0507330 [marine sediment metagenome]|uniref:Terminase large subunit gp17-like C-terminal domain-containing protein n=1 Tax=marine sediment metagenome TaxID=412755 RepID=A0A0F9S287_9ZZZZ
MDGLGSRQEAILKLGRTDSVDGFIVFYTVIHDTAPPKHTLPWIQKLYEAKEKDKGIVIEAFRGSTKTTLMATFVAHQVGLYPHKANLLIQLNDEAAKDTCQIITGIIEFNNAFKWFFHHVVPDKERGWSASGYEVVDTSMPYDDWRRLNSKRKDPTVLGLSRTSHALIGKHPNGICLVDDLDDQTSTSSDREKTKTREILTGTIFPAVDPGALIIVIGTPWTLDDTIAYVKATEEFIEHRTPVYHKGEPVWPEMYDEERIAKERRLEGELQFARMYLLDLTAATGVTLKREWLHYFPHEDIDPTWTDFMGVDYASTSDKQKKDAKRDDFAMCWGKVTPGRTMVVMDGFLGKISQQDSYQKLIGQVQMLPYLQTIGIESIGKGEEFYELMRLAPEFLPLFPIPSHVGRARSKGGRFENVLAPMFQRADILLSTKLTPFLESFKNQWTTWDSPNYVHDDALDAVYMMIKAAEGYISVPRLQSSRTKLPWFLEKEKKRHPLSGLRNAKI